MCFDFIQNTISNYNCNYNLRNFQEPKGVFQLQHNTVVTKITTDIGRKKQQFVFKLSNKVSDSDDLEEANKEADSANKDNIDTTNNNPAKESPSSNNKSMITKKKKTVNSEGTKVAAVAVGGAVLGALTSGMGLLAGMVVVGMGAAAGSTAVIAGSGDYKEKVLCLACDSYHEAEAWVAAIEGQIQDLSDTVLGLPIGRKRKTPRSAKTNPHPEVRISEVEEWMTATKWRVAEIFEGIRILEPLQLGDDDLPYQESFFTSNSQKSSDISSSVPCFRINVAVNSTPFDAFSAIMNSSEAIKAGVVESVRIVQNLDNNTDIIHMKLHPLFLYPTWTGNCQ